MKQVWNIFRKDVRSFYLEILISFAVILFFVKFYPQEWGAPTPFHTYTWVPGTAVALVPVSWLLLISRVVHAESLVGDREFWVTRPYRWQNLLIEKALFLVVFVHVPFTLAQCFLLQDAGFHSTAYIPGILCNLAMATGIVVLPLWLLAAITGNFGKMLLALLLVVAFVGGAAYLSTLMPSRDSTDLGDEAVFFFFLISAIAIIVLQYKLRRTAWARWLLLGVAILMATEAVIGPGDYGVERKYPMASAAQPAVVQLDFRPRLHHSSEVTIDPEDKREVRLSLPISIAGMRSDQAIKADYARAEFRGPGGEIWKSHWQSIYLTWLPGETEAVVNLKVKRSFFERMKGQPVTVSLSLAMTVLQAGEVTRAILPEGELHAPGGTICRRSSGWYSQLDCRSAMRHPPLMLAVTRFTEGECPASGVANDVPISSGPPAVGWLGTLDTSPAEFGITSVWTDTIPFALIGERTSNGALHLCPGSVVGFSPYRVVERMQQQIVTQSLGLADLQSRFYM